MEYGTLTITTAVISLQLNPQSQAMAPIERIITVKRSSYITREQAIEYVKIHRQEVTRSNSTQVYAYEWQADSLEL